MFSIWFEIKFTAINEQISMKVVLLSKLMVDSIILNTYVHQLTQLFWLFVIHFFAEVSVEGFFNSGSLGSHCNPIAKSVSQNIGSHNWNACSRFHTWNKIKESQLINQSFKFFSLRATANSRKKVAYLNTRKKSLSVWVYLECLSFKERLDSLVLIIFKNLINRSNQPQKVQKWKHKITDQKVTLHWVRVANKQRTFRKQ